MTFTEIKVGLTARQLRLAHGDLKKFGEPPAMLL
jgi:hypothetical protein